MRATYATAPMPQPTSALRWSATPRRVNSAAAGRLTVELQEELLEVGGRGDKVGDVRSSCNLHDRVHCALRGREAHERRSLLVNPHALDPGERIHVRVAGEHDGDVAQRAL